MNRHFLILLSLPLFIAPGCGEQARKQALPLSTQIKDEPAPPPKEADNIPKLDPWANDLSLQEVPAPVPAQTAESVAPTPEAETLVEDEESAEDAADEQSWWEWLWGYLGSSQKTAPTSEKKGPQQEIKTAVLGSTMTVSALYKTSVGRQYSLGDYLTFDSDLHIIKNLSKLKKFEGNQDPMDIDLKINTVSEMRLDFASAYQKLSNADKPLPYQKHVVESLVGKGAKPTFFSGEGDIFHQIREAKKHQPQTIIWQLPIYYSCGLVRDPAEIQGVVETLASLELPVFILPMYDLVATQEKHAELFAEESEQSAVSFPANNGQYNCFQIQDLICPDRIALGQGNRYDRLWNKLQSAAQDHPKIQLVDLKGFVPDEGDLSLDCLHLSSQGHDSLGRFIRSRKAKKGF